MKRADSLCAFTPTSRPFGNMEWKRFGKEGILGGCGIIGLMWGYSNAEAQRRGEAQRGFACARMWQLIGIILFFAVQLLTYLLITGLRLGAVVNFGACAASQCRFDC